MIPRDVLILGAGGGFGGLFAQSMLAAGHRVSGVDRHFAGAPEGLATRLAADASVPPEGAFLHLVRSSDWVVSCMPPEPTLRAFANVSMAMRPGALFMDALSVKEPICRAMANGRHDLECLSVHPLFAPGTRFRGQTVVFVRVRPGPQSAAAEAQIREWGAHTHVMTAEEHDAHTAIVQAATHAAILAFGAALASMGYRAIDALPVSTPPHRVLLALLARVSTGDPGLYRHIQTDNPSAAHARAALATALDRVEAAVDSEATWADLFHSIAPVLSDATSLRHLADELLSAATWPLESAPADGSERGTEEPPS